MQEGSKDERMGRSYARKTKKKETKNEIRRLNENNEIKNTKADRQNGTEQNRTEQSGTETEETRTKRN